MVYIDNVDIVASKDNVELIYAGYLGESGVDTISIKINGKNAVLVSIDDSAVVSVSSLNSDGVLEARIDRCMNDSEVYALSGIKTFHPNGDKNYEFNFNEVAGLKGKHRCLENGNIVEVE